MSPRLRLAALGALLAAVAAVGLVLLRDERGGYEVEVPLTSASGLRDGGAVRVGGLDRGTVHLAIDDRDRVILKLRLDEAVGRVGKDAKVAIVAANFLGLKRVELTPGDARLDPAPDGYRLPASSVTTPTDLDQVLDVFDADTRTRAKILLNEAGAAAVGRRVDISTLLKQLPIGMEQAGPALQALTTDDRTMRDLLVRSDRFVGQVARQRRALTHLIATLGDASTTAAAKHRELRAALARAPGTLRTLRGFLDELRSTTTDLGPAAQAISASAPPLRDTLAAVDGFRQDARPTLRTATRAAPSLTRLATGATPTLRRLRPTLAEGADLARALPPVSATLDNSADNIIAILENWSRAIQFRDQLGHVFRGEATFSPDLILTMVDRLTKNTRPARARRPVTPLAPQAPATTAPAPAPTAPDPVTKATKPLTDALRKPLDTVTKTIDGVVGALTGARGSADDGRTQGLLDYLLKP